MFEFLDYEENWARRRIKEELYINLHNRRNVITNVMNIEKGMDIDKSWMLIIDETIHASLGSTHAQ